MNGTITAEYPYVFPPLRFFQKATVVDSLLLADIFRFPKRQKINRYKVLGSAGCIRLTVPLQRGTRNGAIVDVMIASVDPDWRVRHWKTLANVYRAAPFFDYYAEELRYLLLGPSTSFLEFAERTIRWCAAKLGLRGRIHRLSEFAPGLRGDAALLRAAEAVRANEYVQLVGDYDISDRQRFEEAGVRVKTVTVEAVRYHTLGSVPCVPVSILDLLVNEGPEAAAKLRESVDSVRRGPL